LAQARRKGITTLLDECWGLGPNLETLAVMLPHCDYVLPSLEDMNAIFPGASAEQVAAKLLGLGVGTVVLKMGRAGCMIARGSERTIVPAFPTAVVDTTGAGDCWNAGFMAGLANGRSILESARLGNACASYCIQAVGGATGVPDWLTVSAMLGR
jgi:sugar/nucleoside kinase (ribokinase family)